MEEADSEMSGNLQWRRFRFGIISISREMFLLDQISDWEAKNKTLQANRSEKISSQQYEAGLDILQEATRFRYNLDQQIDFFAEISDPEAKNRHCKRAI